MVLRQLPPHSSLHTANHGAHVATLEFAFFYILKEIQSLDIQLAQQRRFPGIPDIRAHRFNVGKRQQVKHLKIVHAPHGPGEIKDGFLVFQVAAKGRVRHQQMVLHEKLD